MEAVHALRRGSGVDLGFSEFLTGICACVCVLCWVGLCAHVRGGGGCECRHLCAML